MSGFWDILRFELRFRFRQVSTYIFFTVLFALALLLMSTDAVRVSGGGGPVKGNAPLNLVIAGTILTALGAVIASATMGTAVYRDFEANAHELFFTTRIGKAGYLLGRFFGAYFVTVFVFLALPLGFLVGTVVPWTDKSGIGAFRPEAYLSFIGIFLMPNLLVIGAFFFVFGTLTRNLLAIYAQGVVLLVAWGIAQSFLGNLDNRVIAAYLDPFGLVAAGLVSRYWTVAERNTNLLPITKHLLGNRLLWLGVAGVIFGVGYRLFAFSKSALTLGKPKAQSNIAPPIAAPNAERPANIAIKPGGFAANFVRLSAFYLREIVTGTPFLVITLAGMMLLISAAVNADSIFETSIYPVTRVMVQTLEGGFGLFFLILITFYAGELTWRERVLRLDQVADSQPVPTGAVLLSKVAAVVVMLALLEFILIGVGMVVQAAKGYFNFEPGLYFGYLFGTGFAFMICLTFLAFFLHALINNKFAGHLCMVLVYIAVETLSLLGFERYLYRFAAAPTVRYSDMNGFGPFITPTFWWSVYWLAFATLLLVAAQKLWVRGTAELPQNRWQKNRIGVVGGGITVLAALIWLGTGTFITYNTDVLNRFKTTKDVIKARAKYERDYKAAWEKKPMPRITAVSMDVTLYPERRQYMVAGVYTLRNKNTVPLTEIALDVNNDYSVKKLEFGIPARIGINDARIGFRTYTLSRPLKPGETTTLTFELAYEKTGFPNDGMNTDIAGNGTFLTMPGPNIGYQPEGEISDETERKKQKLPKRPRRAPATDLAARQNSYISGDADWIDFEATVRTAPDQIALAPGYLQKEWNENGRRCFHYKMDAPILNFYTFVSARYAVKKDTWTGRDGKKVALSIYYHPAHTYDLDRMMAGAKASLTYCSQSFSPYQFRQLRILEFPAYQTFAQSFPNTVPYSEGIGFIARVDDKKGDIDYPYYVTAHETAHQWWAHQIIGANVEGAEMLSESLAEYSAIMVMQRRYGKSQVRRFLRFDLDGYLRGRGSERENESPLVRTQDQQYIHYQKGALAFYALGEEIGHETVTQTLSRFVKDKAFAQPPYPTAPELLAYLKEATPAKDQGYLSDLFERITLYDCRTIAATKKKLANRKYRVTMKVSAKKLYADGKGVETEAPLTQAVEVGVFAAAKAGADKNKLGKPLLFEKHVIKPGGETLTFEVDGEPEKAGIDPYSVLIDRLPNDNIISVTGE